MCVRSDGLAWSPVHFSSGLCFSPLVYFSDYLESEWLTAGSRQRSFQTLWYFCVFLKATIKLTHCFLHKVNYICFVLHIFIMKERVNHWWTLHISSNSETIMKTRFFLFCTCCNFTPLGKDAHYQEMLFSVWEELPLWDEPDWLMKWQKVTEISLGFFTISDPVRFVYLTAVPEQKRIIRQFLRKKRWFVFRLIRTWLWLIRLCFSKLFQSENEGFLFSEVSHSALTVNVRCNPLIIHLLSRLLIRFHNLRNHFKLEIWSFLII